jgi:hypothetical protein
MQEDFALMKETLGKKVEPPPADTGLPVEQLELFG